MESSRKCPLLYCPLSFSSPAKCQSHQFKILCCSLHHTAGSPPGQGTSSGDSQYLVVVHCIVICSFGQLLWCIYNVLYLLVCRENMSNIVPLTSQTEYWVPNTESLVDRVPDTDSTVITGFRFIWQDVSTEYAIRAVLSIQETGLTAYYGIFDVLPMVKGPMAVSVFRGTRIFFFPGKRCWKPSQNSSCMIRLMVSLYIQLQRHLLECEGKHTAKEAFCL